jgi:hypothetical protein
MTKIGHNSFVAGSELPIPTDVRPGPGWTEQMLEMADHIGAYRTLLLVERFGGMRIYVPADWSLGKVYDGKGSIRDVIGEEGARILSRIYCREYLVLPTARHALSRARRQAMIASARAGDIPVSEAARRIGTTRPYLSYLVNQTDEASGDDAPPERNGRRDTSQLDMFGDGD